MQTFMIKESATGISCMHPQTVADSFSELAQASQETFWVVGLNARNKEICRKCLFIGATSKACIDTRIIYRYLLMKDACRWIGVHNHPSGDPEASEEDRALHKGLKEGGELIGIELLDSIIIGDDGTYWSEEDHRTC